MALTKDECATPTSVRERICGTPQYPRTGDDRSKGVYSEKLSGEKIKISGFGVRIIKDEHLLTLIAVSITFQ